MKLEDDIFKQKLFAVAKDRNIELTDEQLNKLLLFKKELVEYNEKVNLTAITDDEEIIYKHFVDSLEVIKYIEKGSNIIDIGSGAGFPGIVIAIYFEKDIKTTLLDSLNKRTMFLESIVKKLELKNVTVLTGRAEDIAKKETYRESYDYATARAVAGLNVLLEYAVPFIKVSGKALLLKGKNKQEEIETAERAMQKLCCDICKIYDFCYTVNNENYDRNIIEITKKKSTDKTYPRNYGRIKKQPL